MPVIRHRKYDRSPLPDSVPEPTLTRFGLKFSHRSERDRMLAQYIERDLAAGANVSDLAKHLLYLSYLGAPIPGMTQPDGQQDEQPNEVDVEDAPELMAAMMGLTDRMG